MYQYIQVCVYKDMRPLMYMGVATMNIYRYTQIHSYVLVYIDIYIHTLIYVYIHIYIYIFFLQVC